MEVEPSCRKISQLELAVYLKLLVGTDNIDLTRRGKQVNRWNQADSPDAGFVLLSKTLSYSRRHPAVSDLPNQDFCVCLSHSLNFPSKLIYACFVVPSTYCTLLGLSSQNSPSRSFSQQSHGFSQFLHLAAGPQGSWQPPGS